MILQVGGAFHGDPDDHSGSFGEASLPPNGLRFVLGQLLQLDVLIGENSQEEFAVVTFVEGRGNEDITTFGHFFASPEHVFRVDVIGSAFEIRIRDNPVQLVLSVLFHFNEMKADGVEVALLTSVIFLRELNDDVVAVIFGHFELQLRIVEKRVFVVETTAALTFLPVAEIFGLLPSLAEGEERGVEEAADGQLGELMQEIVERHPKFAVVVEGQTEFVSFFVADGRPFRGSGNQAGEVMARVDEIRHRNAADEKEKEERTE